MEMRSAPEDADVANIPKGWLVAPLSDLMKFRNGVNADKAAYGSGVPFANVLEVVTKSHLKATDIPGRVSLPAKTVDAFAVRYGDLLFNRTSETQNEIGLASVYIDDVSVVFGGFVIRGRPSGNGLDPSYCGYGFRAPFIRSQIVARGQGAIRANVGQADLRTVRAVVPPLGEQRAIAAALSDVDALIGALAKLIAKKRDLKQAAMQQLLTGQTRLPGFSREWEVKRLDHAGRCLRGVTYKGDSDLFSHDTSTTKRLLRSNNVQGATVNTDDVQFVDAARVSAVQLLKAGDILICMANGSKALVGKSGLFSIDDGFDYTFGAFMGCFRTEVKVANAEFVFYLFQTARYRDYVNNLLAGSSINNLNPGSIESLEFSFPDRLEQTAIASVLSDMDAELAALEARRDKTRALKQGMMQELLTGRIRLV